jgi:hypothetical protein
MRKRSLDSRAMPRLLAGIISVALGAACAGLVSCGGGDDAKLIPADSAGEIIANLDEVAELAEGANCLSAGDKALEIQDQIEGLPRDVDEDLRQALEDGVERLINLTENPESCTGEEITTETTIEEPTVTEPTETEETETEKTETEKTQPTTPTTPTNPGGGVGPGGTGPPGQGGGGGL